MWLNATAVISQRKRFLETVHINQHQRPVYAFGKKNTQNNSTQQIKCNKRFEHEIAGYKSVTKIWNCLSRTHTRTHTTLVCSFKYTNHSLFIIAVNFCENNSSTGEMNERTHKRKKYILQSNCVCERKNLRYGNVNAKMFTVAEQDVVDKIEWYAFSICATSQHLIGNNNTKNNRF